MTRASGSWLLLGAILFVAAVIILCAEFVQWRRFERRRTDVDAALSEFRSRCPLAKGGEHGVRLGAANRLAPGTIRIRADAIEWSFRQRAAGWTMTGEIPPSGTPGLTTKLGMVVLVQNRIVLHETPHLHLLGRMDPSLQEVFDEILKTRGLTYSRTNPFPDTVIVPKVGAW